MKKLTLLGLSITVALALSVISPAVAFSRPEQEAWYTFRVNPYIDIIHLNTNPGGWLNGYQETPSYRAPILGKYEAGKAYIAVDFPTGTYYDMAFDVITIATRDGYAYRITRDLKVDGPTYIWLTPATEEALEGPTMAEAAGSEVTPQAWYHFVTNPYIDIVHLNTDLAPWLWGWAEAPAPCYPAPVLGYYSMGKFYFAMDYIEDGCYALSFWAGTVATRDGEFIRTTDGMSIVGPEYFWLTPA